MTLRTYGIIGIWVILSAAFPGNAEETGFDSIFQVWKRLERLETLEERKDLMNLGFACWKYELFLEAERVFKRSIELYPESPDGYLWLYRTYQFEGASKTVWANRAKAKFDLLFRKTYPSIGSTFRMIPEKSRMQEAGKFLLKQLYLPEDDSEGDPEKVRK